MNAALDARGALDAAAPAWDSRSTHATGVAASPARVDAALRAVRIDDLPVSRLLLTVRAGGGGRRDAQADRPLLQRIRAVGLEPLVDEPGLVLLGLIGQPWKLRGGARRPATSIERFAAFSEPGFARVAIVLAVEPAGDGSRLWTETRITATDADTRRAFARYWQLVGPGSGLIRRELLRATRRRAEAE